MQLLAPKHRFDGFALFMPLTVFLMALSGGMVAGLRAGYAYNTFPLMNGHIVPPEVMLLEPWWRNFVYNMATVQLVTVHSSGRLPCSSSSRLVAQSRSPAG